MSLRDELTLFTPRLRRYARALSGTPKNGREMADALVQRTLMHALQIGPLGPQSDTTVWLYSLLTRFHRDMESHGRGAALAGDGHAFVASGTDGAHSVQDPATQDHAREDHREDPGRFLRALSLEEREAILLVVLEGLNYAQAATILRIPRALLIARLGQARAALSHALDATSGAAMSKRRPPYLRLVK